MKKLFALLVVAAMVLTLFTACAPQQSTPEATATQAVSATEVTSATEAATAAASATEVKKGGLNMKLWIFLDPNGTTDPRSAVLKQIVEDYNKTNAYGNTVTVESFNWATYETQVIQAAAAGTGPDILNAFSDQLMQHIQAGTVQPMTEYATKWIAENPDYIHTAAKLTQSDGQIYSLPWESRVTVMWYRNDIYSKAPDSWDTLLADSSKASTSTALGFSLGLSSGSNGTGMMETFIPWLRSAGGDLFDSNGKAIFNSDAGVKAVQYMKSLVDAGSMNSTAMNMTYDDIVSGFGAGTILATDAGTQRAAAIKKSALADKFSSAPIPGVTADAPAPAFVAGQTLAIGKFAQDPEMAFDFIKFFLTTENQKKWMSANVMPIRTSVYDDPDIKAMANYDEMVMWSNYAKTGSLTFFPPDYTELEVKLATAVQTVVYQGADAKQALDDVANWYNTKNNK